MKNLKTENSTKTNQKVQLVEGNFSPSEASFIVNQLINEKINFHKLQRLSQCEGNETSNTDYADQRIAELENEKLVAKKHIDEARANGYDVFIDGVIDIKFTKYID